jgi:hypothetical protein
MGRSYEACGGVVQKMAGEYNGLGPPAPMALAGKSQLQPVLIGTNFLQRKPLFTVF